LKVKDTISYLIDKIRDIYPQSEARNIALLVLESIGITKTDLILNADNEIELSVEDQLEKISGELAKKRPVQQVGYADFYGLKFRVNENVLIPRSETEELVKLVIKENINKKPSILDIGTGSGCIAICLSKFINGSVITATDISDKSLEVAMGNASNNSTEVKFLLDDIFHTKLNEKETYDILVSNPPYVTESEKKRMHQNILGFEPGIALFVPDNDPLRFYYKISEVGRQVLKKGGKLYVEINEKFGNEVMDLFKWAGLKEVRIIKDINGKDRIVKAKKLN